MLPFTRQVQLASDFAARAAARMAGDEPRGFRRYRNHLCRVAGPCCACASYIATFDAGAYDGAETRPVTLKMRGQDVSMAGLAST